MTVKQKQCLLTYLGYEPGEIDGLDGPKTRAAMQSFVADYGSEELLLAAVAGTAAKIKQKDVDPQSYSEAEQYLGADGYYRIPKNVNVRLTKNFFSDEFDCQGGICCSVTVIYKPALLVWQAIRDEIGEPLAVGSAGGSGYRCSFHNREVSGAANSLHLTGAAADLHYKNPAKLKAVALKYVKDGEVGLYSWGCHVGLWNRGYVSQFVAA